MTKKLIKLISFILTISILSSTVLFANAAQTEINDLDRITINPLYEDLISESDALRMLEEAEEGSDYESSSDFTSEMQSEVKSAVVYGIRDSAAAYLRDEMVARKHNIQFSFKTKSIDYESLFYDIYERAMSEELSVGTSDGDYLKWSWGAFRVTDVSRYISGGYYVYTYSFEMAYYTTAAQEKQVDNALKKAISQLNVSEKSSFDKICEFYNFICKTCRYDFEHINDYDYKPQFTAYGAVINHVAVCQGYATALYKMCKMEGIPVRIITSIDHAWNIVKLGDYYYNIDATWDDGEDCDISMSADGNLWGDYVYHDFFLKSDKDFEGNYTSHIKENEYRTAAFKSAYPISSKSYYNYSTVDNGASTHHFTHQASCAVCGEKAEATENCVIQNGKCIYCNQTGIHNGNTNKLTNCTQPVYCSVCSAELSAAKNHNYEYTTIGTGLRHGVCTVCSSETIESFTTNLKAETSQNGLAVSCDKISNASKYEFVIKKNGSSETKVSTAPSVQFTGLASGTKYEVNARALVNGEYTEWAADFFCTRPEKVTGLKTAARGGTGEKLKISWDAQAGADGYNVYRKENGKYVFKGTTTKNEYTFEDLVPGWEYYFRVTAYKGDSSNAGYGSDEFHTCAACPPMDAPTVYLAGNNSIQVDWNVVNSHGYVIQWSTDASFKTDLNSTYVTGHNWNSYTINTKDAASKYYVRIRAWRNFEGGMVYGVWSSGSKTDPNVPAKVTGIYTAARGGIGDTLRIEWDAQENADSYNVYAKVSGKWTFVENTKEAKCLFENLVPGWEYYYKVAAVKNGKEGPLSDEFHTCAACPPMDVPKVTKTGTNTIKVDWTVVNSHGYVIQWSTDPTFSKDLNSTYVTGHDWNSYSIRTSGNADNYYVRIRAWRNFESGMVYGIWSDPISLSR